MNFGNTFFEISAILGITVVLGIAGQRLRQPLVIMFLTAGILAGPAGFAIIEDHGSIELLAHIGIALLLFIVGLKLDMTLIRNVGSVALATGLGQIVFTTAIGFVIALAMGASAISAAYISVALTFSSTIIIVKLLSDKKEIDSLHGQIALGLLIVQDIAAIAAMVVLTTFGSKIPGIGSPVLTSLILLAKGIGFLLLIAILTKFVIPYLTKRLSQSQEMLALFAISWAVILGAAGELIGFTKEVGAFLAGISLASTDYRDAIGARLTGLRDFLLLFFFIDLGARLNWTTMGSQLEVSAVFSAFVLIGNPLIVCIIMGIMGFRRRTGFLAGLTVAQVSEFSLILAAMGVSLGHITPETMGLITLVGVATIFASTYMILYSSQLYNLFSGPLKIFERKKPYRENITGSFNSNQSIDVILVGLGNYGSGLADHLLKRNKTVIGVDFDPDALEKWRSRGLSVLYGDVADPEIHEQLPLNNASWIVSTARIRELNIALLNQLKNRGFQGKIALTAVNQDEAELFNRMGAHVAFQPLNDAAEQAADSLTQALDMIPDKVDWPVSFRDIRIQSDSAFSGQTIRNIPLRSSTGVSILAVSRAGSIIYDPGPDFQIYPGDRLIIMGHPDELMHAGELLNKTRENTETGSTERFIIEEISIKADTSFSNHTLSDIRFRQQYGVTVVGIRRGSQQITSPGPSEKILAGDSLIVIGSALAIENLKKSKIKYL